MHLHKLICGVSFKDILFWSGAGISANPPSNLPLGRELTQKVIDYFCLNNTWEDLCKFIIEAELTDSFGYPKYFPRLEAVLDSIVNIYGINALHYLSILNSPPNILHKFFASHIHLGGNHITMNIDNCIFSAYNTLFDDEGIVLIDENSSLTSFNFPISNYLIHLHGRYTQDENNKLEGLGLTIKTITYGFEEDIKDHLLKIIRAHRFLFFIGYSGSDYFDVNPFFHELILNGIDLKGFNVIWLKHNICEEQGKLSRYSKYSNVKNIILDSLKACGANVSILEISTPVFTKRVAELWNIKLISEGEPPKKYNKIKHGPSFVVDYNMKAIASANLYMSMGIGKSAINLLEDISREKIDSIRRYETTDLADKLYNRILFILNEAYCELGYYKKANYIINKYNKDTDFERLTYYHRKANCYWLMGSIFRSAFWFQRSFYFADNLLKKYRSSKENCVYLKRELCLIKIKYLLWYLDLVKIPMINCIIPRNIIFKIILDLINESDALRSLPYEKYHLISILDELDYDKKDLPKWLTYLMSQKAYEVFAETDNIIGTTKYTRKIIEEKLAKNQKISNGEIFMLFKRSVLIGDNRGILRSCLLLNNFGLMDSNKLSMMKKALIQVEWLFGRKLLWIINWVYVSKTKNYKFYT